MKDTITEDDMFVDITKTDLEKQLNESNKKREILQEQVNSMEEQMKEMQKRLLGIREKL
jgi:chaperonin cofactor prefoldin